MLMSMFLAEAASFFIYCRVAANVEFQEVELLRAEVKVAKRQAAIVGMPIT